MTACVWPATGEGDVMGEREVERADVVSFLWGEERKFSEAAAQDSMSEDGRERCYLRASTLRTVAAYIERGDHVRTAERTPEMVLRAMRESRARAARGDVMLNLPVDVQLAIKKHEKHRAEVEEHAKAHGPPPRCRAARDGECSAVDCPQLRDGEPAKTGRHCPWDLYWSPRDEEMRR